MHVLFFVEEGDDHNAVMAEVRDRLGAYSLKAWARMSENTSQVKPGMIIDISSLVNEAKKARLDEMVLTSTVEHMQTNEDDPFIVKALTLPARLTITALAESEKALRNNSVTGFFVGQAPRSMRDSANFDSSIGTFFALLKAGKTTYSALSKGDAEVLQNDKVFGPWYDTNSTNPPGGGTWADYIARRGGGEVPTSGPINHGHHIFLKKGRGKQGRETAKEGQQILQDVGIDPIIGIENLTQAPLNGIGIHTGKIQMEILMGLRALKAKGASRQEYVDLLNEYGEKARNAPVRSLD